MSRKLYLHKQKRSQCLLNSTKATNVYVIHPVMFIKLKKRNAIIEIGIILDCQVCICCYKDIFPTFCGVVTSWIVWLTSRVHYTGDVYCVKVSKHHPYIGSVWVVCLTAACIMYICFCSEICKGEIRRRSKAALHSNVQFGCEVDTDGPILIQL